MTTKNVSILFLLTLTFFCSAGTKAQDIKVFQNGKELKIKKKNKKIQEVDFTSDPIVLDFKGDNLYFAVWTDEEVYKGATVGTDTDQDYSSILYKWKLAIMDANAEYVYLQSDAGSALNVAHGAKVIKPGRSVFTIKELIDDKTTKSIGDFSKLFLFMWLDGNKDRVIDQEEILKIKANIN